MSKYTSTVFKASALAAALLLAACSGDGGGGSGSQTVSLSGVVQQTSGGSLTGKPSLKTGINGGGVFSAPITTATDFDDLVSSPLGGALVLITDAQGNTLSGIANADGSFTIAGLDKDGSFAVIFIDTRTLKILGSLVQAADPSKPGQFTMDSDTVLGDILIDPVNQRAISESDVKKVIVVNDASALDKDGDGIISQDDVTELQADTLVAEAAGTTTGGATLSKVSIMSFMGDANTWTIAKETMMDGNEDSQEQEDEQGVTYISTENESRKMTLRRNMSVEGPKGNTINAVKDASITYYDDRTETVFDSGVDPKTGTGTETTTKGYFNYTEASTGSPWGSEWSIFSDEKDNDKINGWASYFYLDPVDDFIYEGEMEEGKIKWRGMLPNNVVLGVPETISIDENWTQTFPTQGGGTSTMKVVVSMDMKITIDKVSGGIMTDLTGKKLPIMRVSFAQTGSAIVTVDGVKNDEFSQNFDSKGAFFVLAKYGIDADVYTCTSMPPTNNDATTDANCSEQTWQEAFSEVRFGVVSPAADKLAAKMPRIWNATDGFCNPSKLTTIVANTACMTTPATLDSATKPTVAASTMPSYDVLDGSGTPAFTVEGNDVKVVRDSWLSAMAQYIDKIDRRDDSGERSWFFIDGDEFGPKIDPKSWDAATNESFPLTGGLAITVETDIRQNGTDTGNELTLDSDSSFRYFLKDFANVTTEMRASMKQYDPGASCGDDRGNTWTGCEVDLGVTSTAITLADHATNNAQQMLSFNMTPPVVNTTNYKEVWLFWEETSTNVWEPYCTSNVSVWFDMVETGATTADDTVVASNPVNFYIVKAANPAVTLAQMQAGTAPDVATHCK